jgi:hypothetical protein
MLNRFTLAIVATLAFTLPLPAQIGITAGTGGAAGVGGHGPAGNGSHPHHARPSGRGSVLLLPYPYYDSDFGYDSQPAAPAQVVVAPVAAVAPTPAPPPVPLEPLMIEWQGDHFERMTSSANASAGSQSTPNSKQSELRAPVNASSPARRVAPQPARELPPAILVFRDGRTEEVNNYTIMSGTIYSKADYWTTGSWNKKIQIADLDVPATLKLNQQRGLNFVLPAGPDEVVIRP